LAAKDADPPKQNPDRARSQNYRTLAKPGVLATNSSARTTKSIWKRQNPVFRRANAPFSNLPHITSPASSNAEAINATAVEQLASAVPGYGARPLLPTRPTLSAAGFGTSNRKLALRQGLFSRSE
jgi:hypothetical protein